MVRFSRSLWIWLVCVVVSLTVGGRASAEAASLVFLNGVPTPVTFNDGDSFRVLEGPLSGSKARLAGFNTLESHGPVHQWGGWHYKELYALAKVATLNARRGVWHCESDDLSTDGYGRILWHCLDLAEDQIRHGFAHVMSVDGPGEPRLIKAQMDAIRHRRGIWAKGVPTYVLTSLHSADEGYEGKTYNRLVNTVDGHSKKWHHDAVFHECQAVCHMPTELTMPDALAVVHEMREDPSVRDAIKGIDDIFVALSINTYIQDGHVPAIFGSRGNEVLAACEKMKAAGRFAAAKQVKASCGIHVPFERRYMQPKPACLKW